MKGFCYFLIIAEENVIVLMNCPCFVAWFFDDSRMPSFQIKINSPPAQEKIKWGLEIYYVNNNSLYEYKR